VTTRTAEHHAALAALAEATRLSADVWASALPPPVRGEERSELNDLLDRLRQWFTAGQPPLVLVGAGHFDVFVCEPAISWSTQVPMLCAGEGFLLSTIDGDAGEAVIQAAHTIAARRRASFRTCAECGALDSPEQMHDKKICQGCAQQNHGVIY